MKISQSKLRQIITEELGDQLAESWRDWAQRTGWQERSTRPKDPRTREIWELIFGSGAADPREAKARLKHAQNNIQRTQDEDREMSQAATNMSVKSIRLRRKGLDDEALKWEKMSQEVETERDAFLDRADPLFALVDVHDLLMKDDPVALAVAEELIEEEGETTLSSLATHSTLAAEFIQRYNDRGMERARNIRA